MTQATQPKVEWGFYAITPRIVRTQYKNLSHAEKWLYVCLKDLCGEKGMCYRTLRSLSEETNISIASLSSMIPNLQKAGLIHAEKKKRSNSGKEIWHISIVDIWQANHEYCSKIEQSEQVVQNLNNDVQNLNEVSQVCSENERVCSDFPYRRITPEEETITEERTSEEREVADATAPAKISSQEIDPDKTEKRRATPPPKKEVVHTHGFSPDAHIDSVVDHHFPADHLQSSSPPRTDNMVTEPTATRKRAANKGILPKHITQQGLMDELPSLPASKPVEPLADMPWGTRKCLQWFDYWRGGVLIARYKLQQAASCAKGLAEQFDEATVVRIRGDMADDPYYIERGGPDICDVANNIHKYLNKKKPKKEPSNEHKAAGFYSNGAIFERNKAKTEAKIAEALAWDEARRAREVTS